MTLVRRCFFSEDGGGSAQAYRYRGVKRVLFRGIYSGVNRGVNRGVYRGIYEFAFVSILFTLHQFFYFTKENVSVSEGRPGLIFYTINLKISQIVGHVIGYNV